ncbi:MAG TPA: hypothetical protein VFT15_09895, partial [Chitinophagaceae bacterium]|nr:hypothetical protein [Chitinophagaceae bacterium]
MSRLLDSPTSFTRKVKLVKHSSLTIKICVSVFFVFATASSFAQTLPAASSCTSKDLELVGASLPPNPGESQCACGGTRTLMLTIANKTGSTRTSFALWGTLEIYNSDGTLKSSEPIFACAPNIPKSATTTLASNKQISYLCGESIIIKDLFLAWTSASPNETCSVLEANPSTIAPKCGTLPQIQVIAGVDGTFVETAATCTANGSIKVSPFGGVAPYKVKIGTDERTGIAAGGFTTISLPSGEYDVLITDSRGCSVTKEDRTIGSAAAVTADAGADFTKSCNENPNGKQIGEAAAAGFTYSWSPADGLSSSTSSNPTANPSSTTTYTVTKTNTATGCTDTDDVNVTVDKPTVTAFAGDDFTKNCNQNPNGKQIGEASVAGFTYSWSPADGLSSSTSSHPTANPSSTATYTVTKTHTTSGCSATDVIDVTVDKPTVTAFAGADFTKNCNENPNGKQIGEASVAGFTYSWSPADGLSSSTISNPTANPSSTTTYTVTKTHTSSGCSATDVIDVTVNKPTVTAFAGDDFTKSCIQNPNGKQIGEASAAGFTYSWSPADGLSSSVSSNPTANPSSTTTYTVTKTHTASGCSAADDVTVTVSTGAPTFTVCLVQPTLCAANSGSVTISATGSGLQYSIDGGSSWHSNGGVFTGL